MPDKDLEVKFRPKSEEVAEAFDEGKEALKDITNNQKYGNNATVNLMVLAGKKYLDQKESNIENLEEELRSHYSDLDDLAEF